MMRTRKSILAYIAVLCCLLIGLAYGVSSGEKAKIKGVIATRTGETLVVSTDAGNVTVVLGGDTKVQQPKGLGVRKKQMSAIVLVPGLRITVDGVGDAQSRVVAKSITFDANDLETAEAIQAGLTPTKQHVQANAQNIAANQKVTQANAQGIAANQVQMLPTNRRLPPISSRSMPVSNRSRHTPSTSPNFLSMPPRPMLKSTSRSEAQQSRRTTKLALEAGARCRGYDWLHYSGEGFCRLLRRRRDESAVEHGPRPGSRCLLDPGLQHSCSPRDRSRSDGYGGSSSAQ